MTAQTTRPDVYTRITADIVTQLEAGVRRDLGQTLTGVAVLAHLEVDRGDATGDRRTHDQVVELAAHDFQILLQVAEIGQLYYLLSRACDSSRSSMMSAALDSQD